MSAIIPRNIEEIKDYVSLSHMDPYRFPGCGSVRYRGTDDDPLPGDLLRYLGFPDSDESISVSQLLNWSRR